MKKPIIRWTIGNTNKIGYEILKHSIKSVLKLYSGDFEYFVCYNDVDLREIEKLKNKFENINFIKQNWEDCPVDLGLPVKIDDITKQKLNGSFWKICPPRLSFDTHEIILDNDLIFLKKPKEIDYFLKNNKNLIITDSNKNTKQTLGIYNEFFPNRDQSYNSGVIGLYPNYDFKKDIIKNYNLKNKKYLSYSDEQGLLMYTLINTNPIIGENKDFADIRPDYIYSVCLSDSLGQPNTKIDIDGQSLNRIFKYASVVHFIQSNRKNHLAWDYFKKKKIF